MKNTAFVITDFVSAFVSCDRGGWKRKFENRESSAFIITKSGKIRFTIGGAEIVSDPTHAVLLPEGVTYLNECLADAESYVFNFHTLEVPNAAAFEFSRHTLTDKIYSEILTASFSPSLKNEITVMERMYALAAALLAESYDEAELHPIVLAAVRFMYANLSSAELTIGDVAKSCNVSEIYLRKLFDKHLNTTPFRKLTELRMEHARMLIKEMRSLTEVATSVGYSDLFQFSRAYKRYYGYAPSHEMK
jgi:AraC-like DNA-binding protein